jgi:cellulose synthase/poly-beta-1,6-N-acetylglucosamine synthase-like glycosyltransferase
MFQNYKTTIEKNNEIYKVFEQDSNLPKAPSDYEKYIYKNGDFKFYAIIALLSASLAVFGQIVWVMKDKDRYPFIFPIVIFTLFNILTYIGAFTKKTFKKKEHIKLVNNYSNKFKDISILSTSKHYPTIDTYLATCGEDPEVVENSVKYISKINWYGTLKHYILDDKNSPEIQAIAKKYNFNYIHRPKPGELKKAGNIRYAFTQTYGDYFVIFDADFCPRTDFLTETMPYFDQNKKIGLIQTPQYFHLTKDSNFIEIGSTAKEELFYRCIQPSRDSFNSAMCVGTNAIYKREAVKKMGGVAPLEHSEDIHTGFNLVKDGWQLKYLPLVLAKGSAPSTINAYFNQQYRWGLGTLMQLFDKSFWFAKIPLIIKFNYINAILYYLNVSTGIILSVLPILLSVMFYSNEIKADEVIVFLPYFFFTYIFHPLWQKTPWNLKCVSANMVANTSYLFALFDMITGSTMEWVPTGQSNAKSFKKMRYYQFYGFLILWNVICHTSILYFTIMNMNNWDDYRLYPIILFSLFYLIITIGILEPFTKIQSIIQSILNLIGLRVAFRQLKSVSFVLIYFLLFSTLTTFAINKQLRFDIVESVSNFSIRKSNNNAIIPVPIFSSKDDEDITSITKPIKIVRPITNSIEINKSAPKIEEKPLSETKKDDINNPISTPENIKKIEIPLPTVTPNPPTPLTPNDKTTINPKPVENTPIKPPESTPPSNPVITSPPLNQDNDKKEVPKNPINNNVTTN